MHWVYKKQFHEWANSVPFDAVLEECCSPARVNIECNYCNSIDNVYFVEWKSDCDLYCYECLLGFLNNEIPNTSSEGYLRKRFVVFTRDNFKCAYCGRNPRDHDTTLEVEHVHPRAKGGTDFLNNLVTACKECNAGKGDYLLNQRQKSIVRKGRV